MEENGASKALKAQSLDDGVWVSVVDLVQKKQSVKESEVLAEINVGNGNAGVSIGEKVRSDENAERLGGVVEIVDLVDSEGFSEDDENEMEKRKGSGNGEMEADDVMEAGSVGNSLDKKVHYDGNGVSLDVEVHGTEVGVEEVEPNGVQERASGLVDLKLGYDFDEKSGSEENKISVSENGRDLSERIMGEVNGEEEEEEMGEDGTDLEYEFSVGDFVWGKIRSHPWWPGQIYDPSDASEAALKYRRRGRFLVAYFGDRSFAWCFPSQLKPLKEEFETMSQQSNSRNFVCAVKEAVDEIGRQVELEMTCSCVPKENQIELATARPMAVNAGIKEGVFVPEGSLGELSVSYFSPADFLDYLLFAACHVSVTNTLELTVFMSRLSAFYHAKGGSKVLTFHEPQLIPGLEDISKNNMEQGLVEGNKLSSHVGTEATETYQISFDEVSDDKLFHTRKQKSVAELMEGVENAENERKNGVVNGEETKLATIASSSGKRRKNSADKSESEGNLSLSPRKKNSKAEPSKCPAAIARVSCVDEGKPSGVESCKDAAKGEFNRGGSETRERKKSKYLSPPYTNLTWESRSPKSNGEPKADSWEVSNVSRMGERMAKASGQLIGSPPIFKCSGQTFQKRSEGNTVESDTVHTPTSEMQKEEQNRLNIDPMEASAPADKVLSDVHSAAVDPIWVEDDETTRKFCSAFRSSIYSDGPNYKMYKKLTAQSGQKRKASNLKHGTSEKDQTPKSPEGKSKRTKHELKGGKNSKAARPPNLNETGKVNDGKFSVPAAAVLVLTFSPGFSSPPKENLIKLYSQFGLLKESETWVSSDSSSCYVAFINKDDAEEAFNHSQKVSLFGDAQVSYRLENFLAPARNDKPEDAKLDKASSNLKTGGRKLSEQSASADDTLPIQLIKRNFEMMTLMLDTMGGTLSPEMKSCLEGEIKALLKKVSSMNTSASN
ncbi:PWWP domain [Dillenia turbinata]|uniref:PWWP domain n=1 Tax=Dillenia turbinata TaxID=194707 RepID=A0AAN8YU61_9MAGN